MSQKKQVWCLYDNYPSYICFYNIIPRNERISSSAKMPPSTFAKPISTLMIDEPIHYRTIPIITVHYSPTGYVFISHD